MVAPCNANGAQIRVAVPLCVSGTQKLRKSMVGNSSSTWLGVHQSSLAGARASPGDALSTRAISAAWAAKASPAAAAAMKGQTKKLAAEQPVFSPMVPPLADARSVTRRAVQLPRPAREGETSRGDGESVLPPSGDGKR